MAFGNDGWSLDFDRLAAAITPRTRALFLVSPSNPTGWTATREDLARAARARAPAWALDRRRRDLCALLVRRGRARAVVLRRDGAGGPHPVRQYVLQELGDDRLAHRLDRGAPRARPGDREHDPVFDLGRRAVHAARRRRGARARRKLRHAPDRAGAARARRLPATRSRATGRCRFVAPQGAFYLFFSVDGETDTRRLVHAPDRRGQCRPGAGNRVRRRRRTVSCGFALRAMPSSLEPRSNGSRRRLRFGNGGCWIPSMRARGWDCNRAAREARSVNKVRKRAIRRGDRSARGG